MFNVSDSPGLTVSEVAGGVGAVTQCGEMFDCLPAVAAAFKHTKLSPSGGLEETAGQEAVGETLQFEEFRLFLQNLRQYFLFCQVI